MAKRHLTFDCPVCHAEDEVVARVVDGGSTDQPVTVAPRGKWICFACRAEGIWSVTLTPKPVA